MSGIDAAQLEDLGRLRAAATPGRWSTLGARADGGAYIDAEQHRLSWVGRTTDAADAELIVAAVNSLPALLSLARRATTLEQRVQALAEELDAGVVAAFVNAAARLRSILAAHEQNGGQQVPTAVEMIAAERARQIEVEHWTPEHDAEHASGDLARAAACYALPEGWRSDDIWPWHPGWWKPSPDDRIRELVKAGALIAAEIDRLQAQDGAR